MKSTKTSYFKTKRATVEALENILGDTFKILDHGFVRVVDYMGDDSAIVQAARVSYGKGTKKVNEDKGLINYLMRHYHSTPFEMCEIKFHIKLPIFIARQWIRHRTASVNEYSARYSILDNEFYLPSKENIMSQSLTNKQGREQSLDTKQATKVLNILKDDATRCYDNYRELLNIDEKDGSLVDETRDPVARELARINLNLNFYTQWYWKINLHNLLHFLRLRADSHAQYEIRVYAEKMLDILKQWVPFTYEAFINYQKDSVHLSKNSFQILQSILRGKKANITQKESGMSPREWREFLSQFSLEEA